MSALALLLACSQAAPVDGRVSVGERVTGELAASTGSGAEAARRFELVAEGGGAATIELASFDFDVLLRVASEDGRLLAEDDDSGVETDARATLALEPGRSYVLSASAKEGSGEFSLSVRVGEPTLLSEAERLRLGAEWRAAAAERALARGDLTAAAAHRREEGHRRFAGAEFAAARTAYAAWLELAKATGDRASEGTAHGGLGVVALQVGDYAAALEGFQRWLELARDSGDRAGEALALGNLGNALLALGDHARAREHYEGWLALALERQDRSDEAAARINLGVICSTIADDSAAREHFELGLEVARQIGAKRWEEVAESGSGTLCSKRGDFDLAREHLQRSLELCRELNDPVGVAAARANLGMVLSQLGELREARENIEACLASAQELGLADQAMTALSMLGNIDFEEGELGSARERHERALALAREIGSRVVEGNALNSLGNTEAALGNALRARELHEQRLALAQELGDRRGEAQSLGNLGIVAQLLGDDAGALVLHEKHLELARELGDRQQEVVALFNLAGTLYTLGENQRARELLEQDLALARELQLRSHEAKVLGNLGLVEIALRDTARAKEHLEAQLAAVRSLGLRGEEAIARTNLGDLDRVLGDAAHAREHAAAAAELADEVGLTDFRISALGILASSELLSGDADAAEEALAEAERAVEELAGAGPPADATGGLRSRFARLARVSQDLAAFRLAEADGAARRDEVVRAGFIAASRWKGRALLEGIADHRSGARSAEILALQQERREAVATRSTILERTSRAVHEGRPSEEIDALRERARAKTAEADELARRLSAASSASASPHLDPGATPEAVRAAVLAPHALLVEYSEGERNLFAYVVGADVLELLDLGPRTETRAEVERFLGGISEPAELAGPAEIAEAGAALFARLLAPVLASAREPVEHLAIVPSAELATLPFEALVAATDADRPDGFGRIVFAIDRFDVSYGPSSPVLIELAGAPPRAERGRALVLADPRYASEGPAAGGALVAAASRLPDGGDLVRLPGTREEAFAIARALTGGAETQLAELRARRSGSFRSEVIDLQLGQEASPLGLQGDLRVYSVLHFACHGFVDAEHPQRSGIALSPAAEDDGFFTIADALELDLDADLVVLSACQTARGEPRAGEGVESIARAFLYAGARGLIASLWQVDDRAAARTMEGFYRAWLAEGLPPGRALRTTKLALRRGEIELGPARGAPAGAPEDRASASDAGHPYYWAPFIHVGIHAGAGR